MNATTTAMTPPQSTYNSPAFWERLWRMSGINALAFLVVAWILFGSLPQVGSSPSAVMEFYSFHRTRILAGVVLSGFGLLNLLWFVAALRASLADAGKDGWGAAATASSAMLAAMLLLLVSTQGALAYSIAGSGNADIASSLNDLSWGFLVLSSFPRAMLIMSGTFGFWRAGLISNKLFGCGVAFVVLVLLGGTTWVSQGFWAPDGMYSQLISPLLCAVWVLVASVVQLTRSAPTRSAW